MLHDAMLRFASLAAIFRAFFIVFRVLAFELHFNTLPLNDWPCGYVGGLNVAAETLVRRTCCARAVDVQASSLRLYDYNAFV